LLIAATVPESTTVLRAALASTTDSPCACAKASTCRMVAGSAPCCFSSWSRVRSFRCSRGCAKASALSAGFFPARDRSRTDTSSLSSGLAGPTSRAPAIGERSLPTRATCCFPVGMVSFRLRTEIQEQQSSTRRNSWNVNSLPSDKDNEFLCGPKTASGPPTPATVASRRHQSKGVVDFVLKSEQGSSAPGMEQAFA